MKDKLYFTKPAPDFVLRDQLDRPTSLSMFKGKWVVLYFYPKDNTPGCTMEAQEFTENIKTFERLNTTIVGVSPDSFQSHQNFCQRFDLKILLLSDPEKKALKEYEVWETKKFMGREYDGVIRSTFLIDPNGRLAHVWHNVRVQGHVIEILQKIRELQSQ